MHDFVYGVGQLVIGFVVLMGGAWLAVKVPAFASMIAVLFLLMWAAVAIAAPIWAMGLHFGRGHYFAAAFCAAAALGMGYLWVLMGWPGLRGYLTSSYHWRLRDNGS